MSHAKLSWTAAFFAVGAMAAHADPDHPRLWVTHMAVRAYAGPFPPATVVDGVERRRAAGQTAPFTSTLPPVAPRPRRTRSSCAACRRR